MLIGKFQNSTIPKIYIAYHPEQCDGILLHPSGSWAVPICSISTLSTIPAISHLAVAVIWFLQHSSACVPVALILLTNAKCKNSKVGNSDSQREALKCFLHTFIKQCHSKAQEGPWGHTAQEMFSCLPRRASHCWGALHWIWNTTFGCQLREKEAAVTWISWGIVSITGLALTLVNLNGWKKCMPGKTMNEQNIS
jgi:hypothetical protein